MKLYQTKRYVIEATLLPGEEWLVIDEDGIPSKLDAFTFARQYEPAPSKAVATRFQKPRARRRSRAEIEAAQQSSLTE